MKLYDGKCSKNICDIFHKINKNLLDIKIELRLCNLILLYWYTKGVDFMRYVYLKSELNNLSQESRIAFVREFRYITQDNISDKLGLTGECKRRRWLDMKEVVEFQKKKDFKR